MRAFRLVGDSFVAEFEPDEAKLIIEVAEQMAQLITDRDAAQIVDPALLRLLPDAYPDDPEATAEFRRFTADSLAERKIHNARVVAACMATAAVTPAASPETICFVTISPAEAQSWLRCLTDMRLTIAARLGIENYDDLPIDNPPLVELYDWLGFVQASLVDVLPL